MLFLAILSTILLGLDFLNQLVSIKTIDLAEILSIITIWVLYAN